MPTATAEEPTWLKPSKEIKYTDFWLSDVSTKIYIINSLYKLIKECHQGPAPVFSKKSKKTKTKNKNKKTMRHG